MRGLTRGAWVRHRPTGRLGRVEIAGAVLVSVAPYPPDNGGWLTARAEDFIAVADMDYPPGKDAGISSIEQPRCPKH